MVLLVSVVPVIAWVPCSLSRRRRGSDEDPSPAGRVPEDATGRKLGLAVARQVELTDTMAVACQLGALRMPVRSERHRTGRVGLLRAAVLGADDGILSTASLILGVAAAHGGHRAVLTA